MEKSDLFISPKKMRSYMDSRLNRVLKDKDLTASQIPFIMEIGKSEGLSMKELCTSLGADKGLTTRVVQVLIANGFVENRSESSRSYKLYLTEKGWGAFNFSKEAMEVILDELLECLEEEDLEHLRRLVQKINRRLDELYTY